MIAKFFPDIGPIEIVVLLVLLILLFGKNLTTGRFWRRNSALLFLLAMVVLFLLFGVWGYSETQQTNQENNGRPKLAVLVVFDQLRGDYLEKWKDYFGKDGFRRLQTEGAWFTNCHYPYSDTVTSIGHASLVTGCSPNKHGIIGNEWYERAEGKVVKSVESEKHRPVPPPKDPKQPVYGVSPLRRRQPSLGDALHAATKGKGKVVVLSIKDTAAAMLAALHAQICCWFSTTTGTFVTSTHFGERLPAFVTEFNNTRQADAWFGTLWLRLRKDLDYVRLAGRDDDPAEGIGYKQGFTFPHPLDGGLKQVGPNYYKAMLNSPQGNELLLRLVKKAIEVEKLGQGDEPDLLCVSFSSNDYVGHCYGPESQEVLDITLHSDLIVKELLDCLDAKVGRDRYILALSSDHGVCPIPEVSRRQGKKADRVSPSLLSTKAAEFLNSKFAAGAKLPWIEKTGGPWIYLNQGSLKEKTLTSSQVERELAQWLAAQPGIFRSYTRTQLLNDSLKGDPIGQSVRRSFFPERSGDVVVVVEPYHLLSGPVTSKEDAYRTSHGTPHAYDTHVPLLVVGPSVKAGIRDHRVTPQASAAILARGLGIPGPAGTSEPVPASLFE